MKGSLIGHGDVGSGASPVVISARGQLVHGATTDLAIGRINIGGQVEFANILAGYGGGVAQNGDAQIGPVKVGGTWAASNLIAGTQNLGADDAAGGTGAHADNVNFGDGHDFPIGGWIGTIIAKIASVTIKGEVFGTPSPVSITDHFGFVATQIGAVKVGGQVIPLSGTFQSGGHTKDMVIRWV